MCFVTWLIISDSDSVATHYYTKQKNKISPVVNGPRDLPGIPLHQMRSLAFSVEERENLLIKKHTFFLAIKQMNSFLTLTDQWLQKHNYFKIIHSLA